MTIISLNSIRWVFLFYSTNSIILIINIPHTQALVSAVLLRPHPQESDKSLHSSTYQIRVQVEQTRLDILRMIRRRWVSIRQEGGFDNMETWVTAD